jgi:hypothetical protein
MAVSPLVRQSAGVSIALILMSCAIGILFLHRYRHAKSSVQEKDGFDRATIQYLMNDKSQPLHEVDGYVAHEIAGRAAKQEME